MKVIDEFVRRVGFDERRLDEAALRARHGADFDAYLSAGDSASAARWQAESIRYRTPELAIDTAINRERYKFRFLTGCLAQLPKPGGPIVDLGMRGGVTDVLSRHAQPRTRGPRT